MYNNFDFNELEKATQESLARIYKESLDVEEYRDPKQLNETYKKVRKILECPEMEKCHPYLYSLDMDDFNDEDTEKINKIYKLGLDRGMYQDDGDTEGDDVDVEGDEECDDTALCGGPKDSLTGQEMAPQPVVNKPIFTVMYSAQKDGHGSMGEYYSMAPTIEGAREDCINQMTANGYNDIMVMAVDQTYPGVEDDYQYDTTDHSLDNVSPNNVEDGKVEDEKETVKEDDSEEYLKQETGDDSSGEESDEEATEETTEETSEDNAEDGANEQEETSEDSTEDSESETEEASEETETQEKSEDSTEEESSEDTESETEGTETKEEDKTEDAEESEEDETDKDETSEEDEEKKLTAEEKTAMATIYTKTFKDVLKKMGLEKSVSEMTLEERTEFYTKLAEKWDKNDPADFMNDKDQEKLNKLVVKNDK